LPKGCTARLTVALLELGFLHPPHQAVRCYSDRPRRASGRFGIVLCLKLDRFGRSLRGILDNMAKLTSLGVPFVVPHQFIDTDKDNPMGRFFINIIGSLAQLERGFIRERNKRADAGPGSRKGREADGEEAAQPQAPGPSTSKSSQFWRKAKV
jgi:hypothetical protein